MINIAAVILAAGRGTRMNSDYPKVLHTLAGKPLLHWVLDAAKSVNLTKNIVIYGYGRQKLVDSSNAYQDLFWALQEEQLGTGHAALQSIQFLDDIDMVLVLSGDVPLIKPSTLKYLIDSTKKSELGLVTANLENPFGLGRVVRNNKEELLEIVEEKDADSNTKKVTEINAGIYLFPTDFFKTYLNNLDSNNSQNEYYLTDLIKQAVKQGLKVNTVTASNKFEIAGINDKVQLEQLERYVQNTIATSLMEQGVQILDKNRLDIRTSDLQVGKNVTIDVNVILSGKVTIGDNVYVGPNTILDNVSIGNDVTIKANTMIEDSSVLDDCTIGPFARIRPGTILESNSKVGNFVEIKKSTLGKNSKVNHLSYIGDSDIGSNVNVGAGTITCNYDGVNKHKTIIEDNVFIGSNTQLVAPIKVGKGATIAAGTTVTKDAPADKLTVNKRTQSVIDRWQRPSKKETID